VPHGLAVLRERLQRWALPMIIPSFESARLTFRGHRVSDLDDCAEMWSAPEVTRFIGGRPFSREEAWTKILRYVGHWKLLGFGYWAVHDKALGKFVGEVGFGDFKREITPSNDGEASGASRSASDERAVRRMPSAMDGARELGWALAPWAHGRGLATEVVQAALAHAPPGRIVCLISPDNLRSIRVAEKCGFCELAQVRYHGAAAILYERP
jgi:RimJ/RimL family protein N-acetyltransferase